MKTLIFFLSISLNCFFCRAQKKIIYTGSYFGGESASLPQFNTFGDWYLRPDSVCVKVTFNTKDSLIKSLAIGKWSVLNENDINIIIETSEGKIPLNGTLNYNTSNKLSPDSVYINGTLIFTKKNYTPCDTSEISCFTGYLYLNDEYHIRAVNNNFQATILRKNAPFRLNRIYFPESFQSQSKGENNGHEYFFDLTFSPNYNFHELNISVNGDDSKAIYILNKTSFQTAIAEGISKNERGWYTKLAGRLMPDSTLKEKMISEVKVAMVKQPLYRSYLKRCLAILMDEKIQDVDFGR